MRIGLDLFDAAIQRQIAFLHVCRKPCGHLHALASTKKESTELCKQHADRAQREINRLSEQATICCVTCEKLVSKKQPTTISELDGTARTQRVSSSLMHVIVVGRRRPAGGRVTRAAGCQ